MRTTLMALIVALMASAQPGASGLSGLDLNGRRVDLLAAPAAKAIVLLFTNSTCPISNRYAPDVARLYDIFASKGISFWLVYPGRFDSPDSIRQHLKEYSYPMRALRDPDLSLADATGATVTPEAVVVAPDGRPLYRGRIDDRYVTLGTMRPSATTHDLESALDSILAGKPVRKADGPAVGCFIADLR